MTYPHRTQYGITGPFTRRSTWTRRASRLAGVLYLAAVGAAIAYPWWVGAWTLLGGVQ